MINTSRLDIHKTANVSGVGRMTADAVRMFTAAAQRSITDNLDTVTAYRSLRLAGYTDDAIRSAIRARRWQRCGRAIVLHNAALTRDELCMVGLINHGPRSALTSFTASADYGLRGWERDGIHVAVAGGARVRRTAGVITHWAGDWAAVPLHPVRPMVRPEYALLAAASSFTGPRPACGILAAGVQQRLVRAVDLRAMLDVTLRLRHRAQLALALDDIVQGAQALSEIDFRRLCSTYRLPMPDHQGVRLEPSGRRRYLDAYWNRGRGRRLVAEVDGAIHLGVDKWIPDQLRQNEIVITGDPVLRFPSVIVRTEPELVADQLRRALAAW